jgi:hypothetical protein
VVIWDSLKIDRAFEPVTLKSVLMQSVVLDFTCVTSAEPVRLAKSDGEHVAAAAVVDELDRWLGTCFAAFIDGRLSFGARVSSGAERSWWRSADSGRAKAGFVRSERSADDWAGSCPPVTYAGAGVVW